jgi:hypothetical protein
MQMAYTDGRFGTHQSEDMTRTAHTEKIGAHIAFCACMTDLIHPAMMFLC